jgi:hypothetical protein
LADTVLKPVICRGERLVDESRDCPGAVEKVVRKLEFWLFGVVRFLLRGAQDFTSMVGRITYPRLRLQLFLMMSRINYPIINYINDLVMQPNIADPNPLVKAAVPTKRMVGRLI